MSATFLGSEGQDSFSSRLSFHILPVLLLRAPKLWFYNLVGRAIDRKKDKKGT